MQPLRVCSIFLCVQRAEQSAFGVLSGFISFRMYVFVYVLLLCKHFTLFAIKVVAMFLVISLNSMLLVALLKIISAIFRVCYIHVILFWFQLCRKYF